MAVSSEGDGRGHWDWGWWGKKTVAFRKWVRGLVKVQAASSLPCWALARLLVRGFSLLGNNDITLGMVWVGLTLSMLIQEVIIVLATAAHCYLQHLQRSQDTSSLTFDNIHLLYRRLVQNLQQWTRNNVKRVHAVWIFYFFHSCESHRNLSGLVLNWIF